MLVALATLVALTLAVAGVFNICTRICPIACMYHACIVHGLNACVHDNIIRHTIILIIMRRAMINQLGSYICITRACCEIAMGIVRASIIMIY